MEAQKVNFDFLQAALLFKMHQEFWSNGAASWSTPQLGL